MRNSFLKYIFMLLTKNPATIWLKWLFFILLNLDKIVCRKVLYNYLAFSRNSFFENNCFLDNNSFVENSGLGSYSYIGSNSIIRNCQIGRFCSIGSNVQIGLTSHLSGAKSTHPKLIIKQLKNFNFNAVKKTIVMNDVWIGNNVIIIGGVKIGNGAIIGAGSIVTKSIPDYAVVTGNPASVIKYRFDKKVIKKLLKSKWWLSEKINF